MDAVSQGAASFPCQRPVFYRIRLYPMAPTYTYEQIASNISVATDDGIRNVVNTAADFVCDLWRDYSEFSSGFADPTGIGKINNAIYSRMCEPRGKRPANPPFAQFTGGQCNKLYRVTGTYRYKPEGDTSSFLFSNLQGPIRGLKVTPAPGVPNRHRYGIQSTPTVNRPDGLANFLEGDDEDVRPFELLSLVATPLSGTDDCGDPPPSYPPKVPKNDDVKKNVNVNIGAGVAIFAPVTLIPTKFEVDAEINPQINVRVGPFNVTFDAGGITVNPSFNFTGDPKVLPPAGEVPDIILPPINQKPGSNCPEFPKQVPVDLTEIKSKLNAIDSQLDDIEECACPVPATQETVSLGAGEAGSAALPLHCTGVSLFLTSIPLNPKIQAGGGNEPPFYFCGYYCWGDGAGRSERIPLSGANNILFPPLWATSFSWSLYEGYSASVAAYKLTPEKSNSEFASKQMRLKPT